MFPNQKLKCLLLYTRFSEHSFWNYKSACELIGAKTTTPPLGLMTVAALLPAHWDLKLLDLNAHEFSQKDWDWAELVCIGGMLPQQAEMLKYIAKAKEDGKYVVVGGPDPTGQPQTYNQADALVLGEGEITIPIWLESWQQGQPNGIFTSEEKPDITKTPIPLYELINTYDYQNIGIQYSRGCPFNCEFCDIIELFGRNPRCKSADQIIAELEYLYKLGYRGQIDIVDDNFIGNKKKAKSELLPALIKWSNDKNFPFFFTTEASINLADDRKLLRQMRAADFKFVFIGFESPDPDVLKSMQKPHNAMRSMLDRVNVIYEYGIMIAGGFIVGFDAEKKGTDEGIIKFIEEASICMSMVGLLVALPGTQLTRRLQREGRLLDFAFKKDGQRGSEALASEAEFEIVDQTVCGLNYKTTRNRIEVLSEFQNIIETIYSPKAYMDRILCTVTKMQIRPRFFAHSRQRIRMIKALFKLCYEMSKKPIIRKYFWRNLFKLIPMGMFKFEAGMNFMSVYLHFESQTKFLVTSLEKQKKFAEENESLL